MSQGFNAYREWLGVAGQSEIPSYYELLALRPLEPDTAQIEAAYQRQSARLVTYLSGAQADVAQRLMGELAEARLTLLTPTAKRAYDTAMASAIGSAARATASPSPVAQPTPSAPFVPQPISAYPTTPQGLHGPQPAAGYGYAGGYPTQAGPAYPAAPAHPGWQPAPAMPAAPGYYPAAAPQPAAPQPQSHSPQSHSPR